MLQADADRKEAATIIVNEILEELGNQIAWWDDKQDQEFRDKYIPMICRIP